MKLIKVISVATAVATAGFCMSAVAVDIEGKSGKLTLTTPAVTNVNVTATSIQGGSWNTNETGVAKIEREGEYMVIDCDAVSSNLFMAASRTTNEIVKCSFTLQPAPVPHTGSDLPIPDVSAQVAFCIATNTASGGASAFYAYVGSGWTQLTNSTANLSSDYILTITFDYTGSSKYAKFSIGDTDLLDDSDHKWFSIDTAANGVQKYCFVGNGNLKSFVTTGQDVAAEEIHITPPGGGSEKTIDVPEELVKALRDAGIESASIGTVLSTDAGNGGSLLENYVLFGVTNASEVTSSTKPEAKIATKKSGDNIPLAFQNLDVKSVSGMTVRYELKGKKRSADIDWDSLDTQTDSTALKITPKNISDGYREFKVFVTVGYSN